MLSDHLSATIHYLLVSHLSSEYFQGNSTGAEPGLKYEPEANFSNKVRKVCTIALWDGSHEQHYTRTPEATYSEKVDCAVIGRIHSGSTHPQFLLFAGRIETPTERRADRLAHPASA